MIASYLSQVSEWNLAFKVHIPNDLNDPATNALRPKLIAEELHELRAAIEANDRIEILDALCDIEYVLAGAVLAWGLREQFDAPTITLRLAKIPDIDAHLAEMFGLNAMMEIIVESRVSGVVAMHLQELQSHLSQMVYHFGFHSFDDAFATVHANNMGKIWSTEQAMRDYLDTEGNGLKFDKTESGYIARREDGKIVKPPGFTKVSLERFI